MILLQLTIVNNRRGYAGLKRISLLLMYFIGNTEKYFIGRGRFIRRYNPRRNLVTTDGRMDKLTKGS